MSQKAELLNMLRKGPVTPLQALESIGCMRVAARVEELRRQGYPVETRLVQSGNGNRFAEYSLGA